MPFAALRRVREEQVQEQAWGLSCGRVRSVPVGRVSCAAGYLKREYGKFYSRQSFSALYHGVIYSSWGKKLNAMWRI